MGTGIRTLEYVDDQGNDGLYDSGQHHHPDRVHFKLLKQDNADSEDHNKKPVCVREGDRCLTCNVVCQVCADVCPNRANVVITLPDGRHEILHVDRMCNECGNCAVFCPYDSAPYRNKFTLFLTREGFDESTENQGFLPLEGRKVLVRLDGKVFEADLDGQNQLPADVETFILTVLKDYAYLL